MRIYVHQCISPGKSPGWFILLLSRDINNRVLSTKMNNITNIRVTPIWRGIDPKLSALTAGTRAHPKVTIMNQDDPAITP